MDAKKFLNNMVAGGVTDFEVCHRTVIDGKSRFTKWYAYKDWPYDFTPNYRTIFKNELVLETDFPRKEDNDAMMENIKKKMEKQKIPFYCIFTGNKSTHMHIFLNHPNYSEDVINRNKAFIAKKFLGDELYKSIDLANLGKHRMIQLEFAPNPKSGNPSKYLCKYGGDIYNLPYDMKLQDGIRFKDAQTSFMIHKTEILNNKAPRYCPFMEYCCKNELPTVDGEKHTMSRNQHIAPNVAAYVLANKEKAEYLNSYYKNQKSNVKREWLALKPEFNCIGLQNYANNNGLGKHCEMCKKYGLYDKYKTFIAVQCGKTKKQRAALKEKKKETREVSTCNIKNK